MRVFFFIFELWGSFFVFSRGKGHNSGELLCGNYFDLDPSGSGVDVL